MYACVVLDGGVNPAQPVKEDLERAPPLGGTMYDNVFDLECKMECASMCLNMDYDAI